MQKAFITYSNGVHLEWDESISVGELITTYYSGYWILEGIEFGPTAPPERYNIKIVARSNEIYDSVPVFHMVQVLNDHGEPTKKNRKCCAASYCRRISNARAEAEYEESIIAAKKKLQALREFLPARG